MFRREEGFFGIKFNPIILLESNLYNRVSIPPQTFFNAVDIVLPYSAKFYTPHFITDLVFRLSHFSDEVIAKIIDAPAAARKTSDNAISPLSEELKLTINPEIRTTARIENKLFITFD